METESKRLVPNGDKETGRIEAFSDGVFAIAITLLVLDLKVPRLTEVDGHASLLRALCAQWPVYLAYVVSFLSVLVMWINHHRLFRHIHRSDHLFLVLNGLLLMSVTIVPFPTALAAEYIATPASTTAIAVYSGVFLVIAILFNVVWMYASHRHRLLVKGGAVESAVAISRQYRFGPLLYAIAFVLAFVNVWASVAMCIGVVIFFAFPQAPKKSATLAAGETP